MADREPGQESEIFRPENWEPKGYKACFRCGKGIVNSKGVVFHLFQPQGQICAEKWALWCNECYDLEGADGISINDYNPYWIALDRLQNTDDFVQWTIHLSEKSLPFDLRSWARIAEVLFGWNGV